jgi:hypothetical protein
VRLPRRTSPLPDDARAPLGLGPKDRVTAAARLRDGSWVAATPDALLLGDVRLDWVSVTHARWNRDDETLSLRWLSEDGTGARELRVDEPGDLPETVYARVTATVVLSRHVPVVGKQGVRIAARRPGGGGQLTWQVVPDRGIDPDAPEVRVAVDTALRSMAQDLGE